MKTAINMCLDQISAIDQANLAFYENNAVSYANQTEVAVLSYLYSPFLELLPIGARILDVGCGSGRDLKIFLERGYEPVGIDPSPSLVEIARERSSCSVVVGRAEALNFNAAFEGVWACASLLHLPRRILPRALANINKSLVQDGIFFLSMQNGSGESVGEDGRFYSRYSSSELISALNDAGFNVLSLWNTDDFLSRRDEITWVNILTRKNSNVRV